MTRSAALVLALLLIASCAPKAVRPLDRPATVERRAFWVPADLKDSDFFCIPDRDYGRCRTVGEIKQFLWTLNAAP